MAQILNRSGNKRTSEWEVLLNTSGEPDAEIAVRDPRVVAADIHTVRVGIAHIDEVAV